MSLKSLKTNNIHKECVLTIVWLTLALYAFGKLEVLFFGCDRLATLVCKRCYDLKEEFRKMQSRLTWLMLVLFAVGIMSVSIVGCGGDTEEESAEKPTESSSSASSDTPAVAARPPIDFAAEKAAIQAVYSEFYKAFNDNDLKAIGRPSGRMMPRLPSEQSLPEMNPCQSPSGGQMLKSLSKVYGSVLGRRGLNGVGTMC